MNDPILLTMALLVGMVLGALFFGGLWWTVRRGLASPRPALWFASSLLLRLGIVLTGFYVVGGTDWRRMVACLAGFLLMRILVLRFTRPVGARPACDHGAQSHAGRAPTNADTELQLSEEPHHAP